MPVWLAEVGSSSETDELKEFSRENFAARFAATSEEPVLMGGSGRLSVMAAARYCYKAAEAGRQAAHRPGPIDV